MENHHNMSQNTATKLRYAIAIASEIRLKTYMKSKRQNDCAIDLNQIDGMEQFLSIVGAASTINYFQIAYCLQFEIAKQLKLTTFHFYSDPHLFNITISITFGMSNLTSFFKLPKKCIENSNEFNFDTCINQLETDVDWKLSTNKPTTFQSNLNYKQIEKIAHLLFSTRILDEALEFYEKLTETHQYKSKNHNTKTYVMHTNHDLKELNHLKNNVAHDNTAKNNSNKKILIKLGICHEHCKNYTKALNYYNSAFEIQQITTLNDSEDENIATTLNNIANCHLDLSNYTAALTFFNRALEIQQNTTLNDSEDRSIATMLNNIGVCYLHLSNYTNALTFLTRALEIQQNTTLNDSEDRTIATTLNKIGHCYKRLSNCTMY